MTLTFADINLLYMAYFSVHWMIPDCITHIIEDSFYSKDAMQWLCSNVTFLHNVKSQLFTKIFPMQSLLNHFIKWPLVKGAMMIPKVSWHVMLVTLYTSFPNFNLQCSVSLYSVKLSFLFLIFSCPCLISCFSLLIQSLPLVMC